MKNTEVTKIELNVRTGSSIKDVAYEAISLAQEHGCEVHFRFNAVDMIVTYYSDPTEVVQDYHQKLALLPKE